MGVLGLGVLMRRGVWGWGLEDPRVWDGMGGLGAGCPHSGGECGVGVVGTPKYGGLGWGFCIWVSL